MEWSRQISRTPNREAALSLLQYPFLSFLSAVLPLSPPPPHKYWDPTKCQTPCYAGETVINKHKARSCSRGAYGHIEEAGVSPTVTKLGTRYKLWWGERRNRACCWKARVFAALDLKKTMVLALGLRLNAEHPHPGLFCRGSFGRSCSRYTALF